MKYLALIVVFVFSTSQFIAQEKWSQTRKPVMGTYSKLPSETNSWQNTNKTIRVYQIGNTVFTVGPNFRVYPSPSAQQDEIILVRHPINQNIHVWWC